LTEQPVPATRECCGRPSAEECRCYSDADALATAIRGFIARRARPDDVDDITQETLLRLYRSAPKLRDESALEGWMYQIARSALVDHHRRAAVRAEAVDPEQLDQYAYPEADEPPTGETALAGCLRPLLARVPDNYRRALELTDLGELTQGQAAARLGLTTSGMKSRIQRGRRLLRDEVAKCCRIELDAGGALTDIVTRSDSGAC
jgi:RNA polymerase sigma-70 factor, ECF subfamily